MSQPLFAQDPAELFDVIRADGSPTGATKRRADVHRDGDWHRAVHVWVAGLDEAGAPYLVFQRRSSTKDTWPGRLDATVGGHYRAGETLEQTLRETEEEIGVAVALADLRPLGVRVAVGETRLGVVDRELQDVFLLRDDRPLTAFRPNAAELAGLARVAIADLLAFQVGALSALSCRYRPSDEPVETTTTLGWRDFIPGVDRYPYRVAVAARSALAGERHVTI